MKMPKMGTLLGLGILAAGGYAAYKFYKGEWELPNLFGFLPSIPAADPQTYGESGTTGQIGDIIYNLTNPDLRERVQEGYAPAYKETLRIIRQTTPAADPLPTPDPEGIFARSVASTVSEDIIQGGLFKSLLLSPFTIGAGLGAMSQQNKWLDTLSPKGQELAKQEESKKRVAFQSTPSGTAATMIGSIFPPTALILGTVRAIDVQRISEDIKVEERQSPRAKAEEKVKKFFDYRERYIGR